MRTIATKQELEAARLRRDAAHKKYMAAPSNSYEKNMAWAEFMNALSAYNAAWLKHDRK